MSHSFKIAIWHSKATFRLVFRFGILYVKVLGSLNLAHETGGAVNTASYSLGSTSLKVSRIGLGLAALGRPAYINLGHAQDLQGNTDVSALEARAHEVLDAAYHLGVRYFDAARSYGKAEQFLGRWLRLRRIPLHDVTVGSKWGYTYTADWKIDTTVHEIKEHSLPVLQRQWTESRSLLGEYLRLYQIHSATLESGVLDNTPVLNELARIKREGVFIGLTTSGINQSEVLEKAIQVEIDGVRLFDCVQATWNLLEPSTAEMLQRAHEIGMGVIIKEALANGRLTSKNQDPAFRHQRKLLEQQASRLNTTLDALSLAAVLAQPWVDVALSGATTVEQLRSNLTALNVRWDEEATATLASLAEPPAVYWDKRSKLAWN